MPFRYQGPPPPEKPNWQSLNSSQKKYAIKQYNIGRLRRNLPLFILGGGVDTSIEYNDNTSNASTSITSSSFENLDDPYTSDELDSSIMSDVSSSTRRGTDTPGPSNSKKSKPNPTFPGTGGDSAMDAVTGNPSLENAVIPRPINNEGECKLVFRRRVKKQLRPYLLGRKFYIVTDHQPLRWLVNHKNPGSRSMHWRLAMEDYEYEIIYKPVILNTNADALSRIPQIMQIEREQVINNKTYNEYMDSIKTNIVQNLNIMEVAGNIFEDGQANLVCYVSQELTLKTGSSLEFRQRFGNLENNENKKITDLLYLKEGNRYIIYI